jgi:hypothetical protein
MMAKDFDPRKVLKQISNFQLRAFFAARSELEDVPWDELKETAIEPVFEAWQELPPAERLEVQVILQDINQPADPRGLNVLVEEVSWRCPERMEEFNAWEGRADRAMWVYLNVREAFDEAAMFSRADALAAGRYWIKRDDLPRDTLTVTPATKSDLAAALRGFYWPTQMRGSCCTVEHYTRANGAEYFFAYLDDYPDKKLVFSDAGEVEPRSERYAFENVFVFTPPEGALELFARGGKKVWAPLQVAFCRAVLGVEVDAVDPLKPAYQLDHLLDANFPLRTNPTDGVADARIIRMRLEPKAAPMSYIELKADWKGHPTEIYQMLDHYLDEHNAPVSAFRLRQAGFRLTLISDGRSKPKPLPFNVSCPNTCDLKSQPDELRAIGERCLKLWGVSGD